MDICVLRWHTSSNWFIDYHMQVMKIMYISFIWQLSANPTNNAVLHSKQINYLKMIEIILFLSSINMFFIIIIGTVWHDPKLQYHLLFPPCFTVHLLGNLIPRVENQFWHSTCASPLTTVACSTFASGSFLLIVKTWLLPCERVPRALTSSLKDSAGAFTSKLCLKFKNTPWQQ